MTVTTQKAGRIPTHTVCERRDRHTTLRDSTGGGRVRRSAARVAAARVAVVLAVVAAAATATLSLSHR